jgi:adenylate kinase
MIIFMGLAGSGKSTQGQLLAAHLHCPWISTGNLLREFNTDPAVKKRMLKGEILNDDTILAVLNAEFNRIDASHNEFILDGCPRSLKQARWLVDKVQKKELMITAIIHLEISRKVAKARLLARHRPDDHEAAIAERFSEYEKVIKPILDYFQEQDLSVHTIDGEKEAQDIAKSITKELKV